MATQNNKLRIIFMGTPEFAVASLHKIISEGYEVVAVVTAPDKPAGRGQKLQQSAVKAYAVTQNLPVLQPTNLKDPTFLSTLQSFQANLQIVVAFRMLPEMVWSMPELGTYNLHASLLPRYRGAAPINHAIINGDKETGVTTFKLSHQIDTGNVLLDDKVFVSDDMNAGELHDLLMQKGSNLLVKTLELIQEHLEKRIPLPFKIQDEQQVTHAPKIYKEHCRISWNKRAEEIYNLIRGLSPHPGAYTCFKDTDGIETIVKIYGATRTPHNVTGIPGTTILEGKSVLLVNTTSGLLSLFDIQIQGKKRMKVAELLNGYRFPEPLIFY